MNPRYIIHAPACRKHRIQNKIHSRFLVGSCWLPFSFLHNALQIIMCRFVLFILTIILSVLLGVRLLMAHLISTNLAYSKTIFLWFQRLFSQLRKLVIIIQTDSQTQYSIEHNLCDTRYFEGDTIMTMHSIKIKMKRQTTAHNILHRTLKIKQHQPHYKKKGKNKEFLQL